MKERKVIVTVVIEEDNECTPYKDSITTDNIVTAVDFYNKTMNQLDKVDYNDFPVFMNECQEVDYVNGIVDSVAKRILEKFDNPAGTFGGDLLNKICDRYYIMKRERNLYLTLFSILLISLLVGVLYIWGNIC